MLLASEFSRQLVSEQGVNWPCMLVHVGKKMLGKSASSALVHNSTSQR